MYDRSLSPDPETGSRLPHCRFRAALAVDIPML